MVVVLQSQIARQGASVVHHTVQKIKDFLDACTTSMQRWKRLERYTVWRQHRFPLLELPEDILYKVVSSGLTATDVTHLVTTICGFAPKLNSRQQVQHIPLCIRATWVAHTILSHFKTFLVSMADRALFHAMFVPFVCVFADWSPFSGDRPTPIAEYRWVLSESHPQVKVTTDERCILDTVRRALENKSCIIPFGLSGCDGNTLHDPILLSHYTFGPTHILPSDFSSQSSAV